MKTYIENSKSVLEIDGDYPWNGENLPRCIKITISSKLPDGNGHTHGYSMMIAKEDIDALISAVSAHKDTNGS